MLNIHARRILYGTAVGIKREHPEWSTHTCLEEAMFRCGRSYYIAPLQAMLKEYGENQYLEPSDYLKQVSPKRKSNEKMDSNNPLNRNYDKSAKNCKGGDV